MAVPEGQRGEGRFTVLVKANLKSCGWKDHAAKGNSFKLIQRMEAYYNKLWEE